jgi:hypothetical protein
MEGYFLQAPAVRQTALARLGIRYLSHQKAGLESLG